jgi:hypothetical protein
MEISEKSKMKGSYLIEARDAKTNALLNAWRFDNQLTTINQTIRTQMLLGTYTGSLTALQIKYFALGTGTAAVSPSNTALGSEQYRKQITQITNPSTGVVQSVCSFGATEANFTITEIGVFCGPSAGSTSGSGTMLSRVLVNITKNSNIILNIIRTDTVTI